MAIQKNNDDEKKFLSSPEIAENLSLLKELGLIDHIESLNEKIDSYKNLFASALDIVKRISTETSIIIMDVDYFKDFNDSYGHLAGDRVLENLEITIKKGIRPGDVPSRFGGEKFTILLPDANSEMAWTVAEQLRTMVENMKVEWEPPLPQVTISLGVFTFQKSSNLTADEIMGRADEALYISKQMGRNRSTAWGAGLLNRIELMKREKDSRA